jgi:hypothetical protein
VDDSAAGKVDAAQHAASAMQFEPPVLPALPHAIASVTSAIAVWATPK